MGLDSYFYPNVADDMLDGLPAGWREDYEFPEVNLIGGMFSDNGSDGSFRGKCYDDFVEEVTSESLYQERIEASTVKQMAGAITNWLRDNESMTDDESGQLYGVRMQHLRDLGELFETAAAQDMILVGWW